MAAAKVGGVLDCFLDCIITRYKVYIIFIDILPEEESKSAVATVGGVLGVIIFILVAVIIVLGIALRVRNL